MKIFSLILFFSLISVSEVTAEVRVLDGDSIILDGDEIRLIGIDAPEYRQYCFTKDKDKYDCGEEAKKAMKNIVKDKIFVCNKIKKDIYDRHLSECFADDSNINVEMLRQGWAIIYYAEDNEEYMSAQNYAKDNKLGMWQGKFIKPEFFRMLNKNKGKTKSNKKD